MLMVLEMAPEMNGWAAAIILMWPVWWMNRSPYLPLRLAQSNTGRCSARRWGAPSMVWRPQMKSLAARICSLRETERRQQPELHVSVLFLGEAEPVQGVSPQGEDVEGVLQLERAGQGLFHLGQVYGREPLLRQAAAVDVRGVLQR